MTLKKRIATLLLSFLLLFVIGGETFLSAFGITASAETVEYSNVLDDLQKDEKFDVADYPAKANDYSLQVIQVARASRGMDLYVYVYQPSAKYDEVFATSINFSVGSDASNLNILNYPLQHINTEGSLQKYVVLGHDASSYADKAVYDVTSIYREPVNDSEATEDLGNYVNEVPFKVGKRYTFTRSNGKDTCTVDDLDVITVTNKYVGFVRYPANYFLFNTESVDVHYIAFSTDRKIDKLLEADVFYQKQSFQQTGSGMKKEFGKVEKAYSYLKFGETIEYEGDLWWSNEYSWNVIEKPVDFLKSEEGQYFEEGIFDISVQSLLSEEKKEFVSASDWVIRFAHTDYKETGGGVQVPYNNYYYTIVSNVSILRLAFETDGVYYNLGVIDNKQTGSGTPDNKTTTEVTLSDEITGIFMIIAIALIVIALWNPIKALIRFVFDGLETLFDWCIKIITSPFRFIKWLTRK